MPLTIYDLADDLKNENESIVLDVVHEYQTANRLPCNCRECLLDITALALNAIEPRYCVALLRELDVDEAKQTEFEQYVREAVDNACEVVKKRPHHFDTEVAITEQREIEIDGEKMEFN